MLRRYEDAIWNRIDAGELDPALLGAVREAATWQNASERASAVEAIEAVLDHAAPGPPAAVDLRHVSTAAIRDRDPSPLVQEILKRAGPELGKNRVRAKRLPETEPVCAELVRLSERFGARVGSVGWTPTERRIDAYSGREGEIHWVIPKSARQGLDAAARFGAGRLAYAVPRGAGALLDDSTERAAGLLAAVLRAAGCELGPGATTLPSVVVKLRRAARKSVQEAVGDARLTPQDLLAAARQIRRNADRAGLIAAGDIGAALQSVLGARPTRTRLQASGRGLELLRFWAAPDSPRWRRDA
jgi:hypothetical protein